jgi:cellulose synthase (UDP-forming)
MLPLYSQSDSYITGQLSGNEGEKVRFRSIFSPKNRITIRSFAALLATVNLIFLIWFINPSHLVTNKNTILSVLSIACFCSVLIIELIRILQATIISILTMCAVDPIPMQPAANQRIAILTTIVPSKEPLEMVVRTLQAMKQIHYDGAIDVWILDEGNDPEVQRIARKLGIKHFSRKGIVEFNQTAGPYREKSKAGNHNAWRAIHEAEYDFVAQMDPDHIPFPNFLERTLGYFNDPNTGFVVAPQVYGNQQQNWIARASASQAYLFHGILQRAGNAFGSPLLIGTNHIYRTKAWAQIDGYQDSVIEDHLTSMTLNGTFNPVTGNKWRGVYTPDIVSVGEGPTSWQDYFSQQKRWSYGIWEILLKHSHKLDHNLKPGQSFFYVAMQFFYPSVAISWILGFIVSALYFTLAIQPLKVGNLDWLILWGASFCLQLGSFLWLNRFNLNEHEKHHGGVDALLLTLFTAPVYTLAALRAVTGKTLHYAVTAKGALRSSDSYHTFMTHLQWTFVSIALLLTGIVDHHEHLTQIFWDSLIGCISLLPIAVFTISVILPKNYIYAATQHMLRVFKSRHVHATKRVRHHSSLQLDPNKLMLKLIHNL